MGTSIFGNYHRRLPLILGVVEPLLLFVCVYLAALIRFEVWADRAVEDAVAPLWPKALVFAGVGMAALISTGLYNQRLRDRLSGTVVRLAVAVAVQAVTLGVLFYVAPAVMLGRGVLLIALILGFAALITSRAIYFAVISRGDSRRRVLVLGGGYRASHLLRFRRRTDFIGINFVGFVTFPGEDVHVPDDRCLEVNGSLLQYVHAHRIDQLVIAVDDRRSGLPMNELLACRTSGVDVVELVAFLERELGLLKLDALHPGWLVFSPGFNRRLMRLWMKRLFDVAVSSSLLVAAGPLMLLTALAIWLESGGRGPVLYRQVRVGEEGLPFDLIKFRSMRPDAEAPGKAQWAKVGDPRITRVGRFIRKYRIDELPQLFNILSGKMSFVGPRPERPEFVSDLERQIPYYAERHRVKPGLTGWAQVRYPYGASREDAFQKLQFDLYYAKNHNLLLDFTIMLQTAEVVLWGRGAR